MKIISFSFDDGFINTAHKVVRMGIPSTFYIVTGWVLKTKKIYDKYNLNINHGELNDWKNLPIDIGCHSNDHKKDYDIYESYKEYKNYFGDPYNFACPYGIYKSSDCFQSIKVGYFSFSNDINKNSLKKLSSVNPVFDYKNKDQEFFQQLKSLPDNKWVVLTFHGIDEGWEPITQDYLFNIYNFVLDNGFVVKTITEVVNELSSGNNNI